MDVLHELAVVGVDGDALGVVDVVDDQIAVGACDDADVVTHTRGTALHVGKDAVGKDEADGVGQIHTCGTLHTLALHADDIGWEEHADEVQGIDSQVEQGSSTEVRPHDAWLVTHAVAKGGGDQAWGADTSFRDQVEHHLDGWLIACPDGFGDEHLPFVCQIQHFLCLTSVCHKGFLHQTGLACQNGFLRHIVVMRVWGTDIDQVHIGVGNEFAVRTVCFLDVPLLGKGNCLLQGS